MLKLFESSSLQESLHETNSVHDLYVNTPDNYPSSNERDEFQDWKEYHPDQYLEPPPDDLLDFINSQDHFDDQLVEYCKLIKPTMTVNLLLDNFMLKPYHVAQANCTEHGSLVDRGANGGLAGSDVRVLSTSPRKCTVTGIDNHEIPGLDLVQYAALVDTNHGIVSIIMNDMLIMAEVIVFIYQDRFNRILSTVQQ